VEPAGAATELTLVRHGRTIWHRENRYAGASDVPLDEVGRAQAAALAHWARSHPHDAVACSPLHRARETAAPVAEALGLSAEVNPALREMDFGVAEGRTLAELHREYPDAAAAFVSDPTGRPFPGAEPPEQVAERALGALRAIAGRHPGASVLVVGHNTALRLALCGWLGIALERYRDVLPRLENAAVTRLRVSADPRRPPALLCLNVPVTVPVAAAPAAVPRAAVPRAAVPPAAVPSDAAEPASAPAAVRPAAVRPAAVPPDAAEPASAPAESQPASPRGSSPAASPRNASGEPTPAVPHPSITRRTR
jgi:probable phosphoglycerate mutase